MQRESFESGIRHFLRRSPFSPFVVHLGDGRALEVTHPEAMALSEKYAVYIAPEGDFSIIDHENITEIKGPGQATPSIS